MKKTAVVLAALFATLLSACLPFGTPTPGTGSNVDTAGTADAQFKTAVVQTLTAQSPLAPGSVTDTPTVSVGVESPTLAVTDTPVVILFPTQTFTLPADLTSTPVTATGGPANAAASSTPTATLAAGQVTASPTLGIRLYGTLPPEVPFNRITLRNKSKAEAYISLQVTMPDGKFSILEYPVEGTFKIKAPVGSYVYVAWVGGRKMVGNFRLNASNELLITLYKDKVVVR